MRFDGYEDSRVGIDGIYQRTDQNVDGLNVWAPFVERVA